MNKVGFVVAEDVPFGPQRWVTLRLPEDDVVSVSLNLAESDENRALVGKQGGTQPLFGIVTDDCLREYRRMKDASVKPTASRRFSRTAPASSSRTCTVT